MVRSDYRCSDCGSLTEHEFSGMTLPPTLEGWCDECSCLVELKRKWSVHTGRGSSGEPSR